MIDITMLIGLTDILRWLFRALFKSLVRRREIFVIRGEYVSVLLKGLAHELAVHRASPFSWTRSH